MGPLFLDRGGGHGKRRYHHAASIFSYGYIFLIHRQWLTAREGASNIDQDGPDFAAQPLQTAL